MKSNYDVYMCRGYHQLVGLSMNEFLSNMDYLESIKSTGDCLVLFYDDETKIITRAENMKVGQGGFNQSKFESCFVIGGPFDRVQRMPSLNKQESINNKILAAYDENVARRKVDKSSHLDFGLLVRILLLVVAVPLVVVSWFAAY